MTNLRLVSRLGVMAPMATSKNTASGVPGTGKTATVKQVMRYMLENKEDFPEFTFHEINGMRLTCPEQVKTGLAWNLHSTVPVGTSTFYRYHCRGNILIIEI